MMWRFANNIYRAFRQLTTHRYSHDIIVPLGTVRKLHEDLNEHNKEVCSTKYRFNVAGVKVFYHQYSFQNVDRIKFYLLQFYLQQLVRTLSVIKPVDYECHANKGETSTCNEEALNALLQADKNYLTILKYLSELNQKVMSIINNHLAIEEFEAGQVQSAIEKFHKSAQATNDPASLYNLGICYEQGIGVETDLAKACDFYYRASTFGHIDALFRLNLLSNCIKFDDDDDEDQAVTQLSD